MRDQKDAVSCSGRDADFIARPPAQNRTCSFPAYGLYGTFFVKRYHLFLPLLFQFFCSTRAAEHSSAPTAYFHRRRAQRRSRTALLQRRRRLVLDGREHGGRLLAIVAARESEGSLPLVAIKREPCLYSVEPKS